MRRFQGRRLLGATLAGVLLLAACGGTDDGEPEASATTDAPADTETSGETSGAEEGEEVQFRVTDLYSLEHSIGANSIQPFMENVEAQTEGRISFEYFPSNQLIDARDAPDALASGTADIGNVLYLGSQNPMMYVAQLPGLFADDEVVPASEAFWEFIQTNESVQAKFEELRLRPLFCFTVTNYQLEWPEKGIDTLEEINGKQIRAAGAVLPFSIQALGAGSVDVAIGEAFDAFNRGVIDGIALSVPSTKAYAFYDIIESAIINMNMGGFPVCYAIGQEKWDSLSAEDQEIIAAEADATVTRVAEALGSEVQEDLSTWEERGMELYEIDEEARDEALAGVEGKWLDQLEGDGVDRSAAEAAVEEWKSLLDEHLGN